MIEIKKLSKHFGPILAVDDISFTVNRGEVLGFLGPNGAGKSTTMKMVTGFLTPTSGTAIVCGHDVLDDSLAVRRVVGYLPEGAPAYPDMTPESFLNFVADVRGLKRTYRKQRLAKVAEQVHLEGVMRQPIGTLSKGYKRRVGLAQALLHDPEVLIMDEPTDGLDPNQKYEVRKLIRELSDEKVIVLSTHILEEVQAVCTRAIIIAQGKLVADFTPSEMQARSKYHNAVRLRVRTADKSVLSGLNQIKNVKEIEPTEPANPTAADNGCIGCIVIPKNGRSIVAEVSEYLRTKGVEIDELHVEPGRLDDVFREITTHTTRKPAKEGT